MNNKQLIKKINNAYNVKPKNKIRFIRDYQKPNVSLFSFITNQFKLISNKIYISCFVYFVVLLMLLLGSSDNNQYILLASGIPFFSLLMISLINTSNMYKMSEIEMPTLFSLKMVILARMLIMSFITMFFILIIAVCTSLINNISILRIIYYFFIPYFLNTYLNLKLLKRFKNEGLKYCFVLSSIICLLILFLINNPSLITLINSYMYVSVLILLMILSINEFRNYVNRLEEFVWNLN